MYSPRDEGIHIYAYTISPQSINISSGRIEELYDAYISVLEDHGFEIRNVNTNEIYLHNYENNLAILFQDEFCRFFGLINGSNRITIRASFLEDQNRRILIIGTATLNANWVPKELNPAILFIVNSSIPHDEFRDLQRELEYITFYTLGDTALYQQDTINWSGDLMSAYRNGVLNMIIEIILIQMMKTQLNYHIFNRTIKGETPADECMSFLTTINSFLNFKIREIATAYSMSDNNVILDERGTAYIISYLNRRWIDLMEENTIMNLITSIVQVKINKHILRLTWIVVFFGILSVLLQLLQYEWFLTLIKFIL